MRQLLLGLDGVEEAERGMNAETQRHREEKPGRRFLNSN
jgi:hypothetical protein